MSTFLSLSLDRYHCWWTISFRVYHPPSSVVTGIAYKTLGTVKLNRFWLSWLGLLVDLLASKDFLIICISIIFYYKRTWWMLFQKRVVCPKLDLYVFIDCVKQVAESLTFHYDQYLCSRKLNIPLWSVFMAMSIHLKYNVKPFSFFRKRSGFHQSQSVSDVTT